MTIQIAPCLWFDRESLEAAQFYTSIFPNSKINAISHYGKNMHMPEGTVMTVSFTLNGHEFLALNGGPQFKFTEAISLMVNCDTQAEIDYYWERLTADGGQEVQCGWLKDKYGLSWQIAPAELPQWIGSKDQAKTDRVMAQVMKMVKLDLATMKRAAKGG